MSPRTGRPIAPSLTATSTPEVLVYGDRSRSADARTTLKAVAAEAESVWAMQPGPERHSALIDLFVLAGEWAAAVADAELGDRGVEAPSAVQDAALGVLSRLAEAVAQSWRSGYRAIGGPPTASLEAAAQAVLPSKVTLKTAEGFAFYAVYPEAYLEAAQSLSCEATVIGLRSIGAPLAALVAAGAGAERLFTLRPAGPPFDRRPSVSPALATAIAGRPDGDVAIVDEGPGLSGSSFGGVADWLQSEGVAPQRIVFFPSHRSDPGPEAQPKHRRRWLSARREVRTFDDLFLSEDSRHPLSRWFADHVGEPLGPLEDLSGGAWREGRSDAPPAYPGQERRKFRLRTASGAWLLKYAGRRAGAKLERAKALHAAGFSPEPVALRSGILLERWREDACPPASSPPVDRLADYLSFRSTTFRADEAGAALTDLLRMGRRNVSEALGAEAAEAIFGRWATDDLIKLQERVMPIHVDGRLHRWEWLQTPAGLLKSDAIDHSEAHDLVGPQDLAWDVAGAIVECHLDAAAAVRLQVLVSERAWLSRDLVAFLTPAYLAFQLGLWTFAAAQDAGAAAQRDGYAARLRALAG